MIRMFLKLPTLEIAWPIMLAKIMDYGRLQSDERHSATKELSNLMVTITNPNESLIPKKYPLKMGAEVYKNQMLNKDRRDFVYTYGNRLREHFRYNTNETLDQVEEAIKRLQQMLFSRRSVMVTYDPVVDTTADEIPCMIMVDFKYREGKLDTTAVWRSHDIFGAYPTNFIALRELANYVADKIGAPIGKITTHSVSAHIYEVNWDEAERAKAKSTIKRSPETIVGGRP
jgi:thymidylate synthase